MGTAVKGLATDVSAGRGMVRAALGNPPLSLPCIVQPRSAHITTSQTSSFVLGLSPFTFLACK